MAYNYGGYMPHQGYGSYYNQQPQQQAPRYEVIHVNGQNGAQALQMAPNSNAIVMDDTAPLIWLCQTDGAGYKTVQAFDISPHKDAPAVDVSSLEERIARLEGIINGKSAESVSARKSVTKNAAKQSTCDDC